MVEVIFTDERHQAWCRKVSWYLAPVLVRDGWIKPVEDKARNAFDSAKNRKRQRRKRQSS